jgi:CrcB protein
MVGLALPSGAGVFPTATLVLNLVGSVALGLYITRRERAVVSRISLHFWAIGVLGSLTTFSTFSVEVLQLIEAGSLGIAGVYAATSTLGGLSCAVVGSRLGEVWR